MYGRSTALFALILIAQTFSIQARGYTIVIDPGHGGSDHGATQGTIIESKIALEVALKLADAFSTDSETKVILTRNSDSPVSLKERVSASNVNRADLFVSLHGNSSTDRRAKGAEFYVGMSESPLRGQKNVDSENSVEMSIANDLEYNARLFQSQYLAADSFKIWKTSTLTLPRSIKQAPFFVINKNITPAILVELGFITNSKEAADLLKEETQKLIADQLHSAINQYRTNRSRK